MADHEENNSEYPIVRILQAGQDIGGMVLALVALVILAMLFLTAGKIVVEPTYDQWQIDQRATAEAAAGH